MAKKESKYVPLTVLVEPDQLEKLKELAALEERSLNGQTRVAIRQYLERAEAKETA